MLVVFVNKLGSFFVFDGFIKIVKYSDLEGFNFFRYYFYYYGQLEQVEIKLKGIKVFVVIKFFSIEVIIENLRDRYSNDQ